MKRSLIRFPRFEVGLHVALVTMGVMGCSDSGDSVEDVAAAPSPDTDVYLVPLQGEGRDLAFGVHVNITDRPGYDNQPAFTPDGNAILYTAMDEAGATDIMRYDLGSGRAELVTQTYPESEYSATPLPDGSGFSAIRVEADSTQRLWRFDWDGSNAAVLLPDVAPAGYHAWADAETLILFVLGTPPTLQIARRGPGVGRVVDREIGRSLQPVPPGERISYVALGGDESSIRSLDPTSGESEVLAPVLGEGQDHAWTPGGTLLMASGGTIHRWSPEEEGWAPVPMELTFDGEITRLAVSPNGSHLAFVGAR